MIVQDLQTTEQLIGQHQHRFEREDAAAVVEQIFQIGAEEVKHQRIVFAFRVVQVNAWDPRAAAQRSIDGDFLTEERRVDGDMLEFDRYLDAGVDMDSFLCVIKNIFLFQHMFDFLCLRSKAM